MSNRVLSRIVWVPSLIAILVMTFLFARHPQAIAEPSQMVSFTTDDKTITVDHPSNWRAHSNSQHDVMTEVWFLPANNSELHVSTDFAGSLMGDIARSSNNMMDNLGSMLGNGQQIEVKKKSPLEQLHESYAGVMEKEFDDYQEGTTEKTTVSGMEALATSFTFKKPSIWGSREMVGKRFTALPNDRRVKITYYCQKDMQGKLEPTFQKMLATLRITQGGS